MHPRWEIPGFDFRKDGVWRVRARRVAALRRQMLAQGRFAELNAPLAAGAPARSAMVVSDTQFVPVLLFSYQGIDSTQFMRDSTQYRSLLFDAIPPGGNPYTLRTFYEQMSNGLFSMQGKVMGWVRLDSTENTYAGIPGTCTGNGFGTTNCNGIFSNQAIKRMHDGFRQALARVDVAIDFGEFDNDGPDGIPNSGDDDGFVDMMMFAHPTRDGACGGATNNHIWSHRFILTSLVSGNLVVANYVTNDAWSGHPGQFIKISDYFAGSALGGATSCDSTQIMPIGTAAHEFGHGLGLPDLYDTGGPTEGIGEWGLMGAGNFSKPTSPSRMEAWSLNELGWVTVVPLTTAGTFHFGAAPTSDTTFKVDVQGSNPRGEFFLLENRQPVQADSALIRLHCVRSGNPPGCGGGLLLFHVDQVQVSGHGFQQDNRMNVGPVHGLAIAEADGLRQLWCEANGCNRGDAGDVYPGTSGNSAFSFNTTPAATKNVDGSFVGLAIDSIRQVVPGGEMAFRLRFGNVTIVRGNDTNAVVSVDAANYRVFRDLFEDASTHTIGVADTQVSLDGRTRWRFVSWSDAGARTHQVTGAFAGATYTATLARDFLLTVAGNAGGSVGTNPANASGTFLTEASSVQVSATPNTGFLFGGWSGDTIATAATITIAMARPYSVAASFLTTADVVAQILGPTQPLTVQQQQYLDALGNNNGSFDIGDFLAWVKATGAPLATPAKTKGGRP